LKILIIDDEQFDLFINKKLLSLEFEVEGFTTIKETVQWAQDNTFDIALIDYYLGTDLYAQHALKELLSIKGNTFKSFVLSNYVDQKQIMELKAAGFTDVILKPLTLEGFKDLV
jgi:DNA-binding NarL/FixJ family response regulator